MSRLPCSNEQYLAGNIEDLYQNEKIPGGLNRLEAGRNIERSYSLISMTFFTRHLSLSSPGLQGPITGQITRASAQAFDGVHTRSHKVKMEGPVLTALRSKFPKSRNAQPTRRDGDKIEVVESISRCCSS